VSNSACIAHQKARIYPNLLRSYSALCAEKSQTRLIFFDFNIEHGGKFAYKRQRFSKKQSFSIAWCKEM